MLGPGGARLIGISQSEPSLDHSRSRGHGGEARPSDPRGKAMNAWKCRCTKAWIQANGLTCTKHPRTWQEAAPPRATHPRSGLVLQTAWIVRACRTVSGNRRNGAPSRIKDAHPMERIGNDIRDYPKRQETVLCLPRAPLSWLVVRILMYSVRSLFPLAKG